MTNSIRLQKFLSESSVASRRKSEELIKDGKVKVNGKIISELGVKVSTSDNIEVNGKKVFITEKVYIVLNKPKNVLSAHTDSFGRPTIYDIVKPIDKKIFSVGRLDYHSTGLLILTNDGDFAQRVIHPSSEVIKEYTVESFNTVTDDLIKSFLSGILIENILYKAEKILTSKKNKVLKIFLKEGKKREIRVVYKYFDIGIKSLKRSAIGGLRLDKTALKEGKFREFSKTELEALIFYEGKNE